MNAKRRKSPPLHSSSFLSFCSRCMRFSELLGRRWGDAACSCSRAQQALCMFAVSSTHRPGIQACHEEASACNTLTARFSSARVGLMEGGCCGGGVAMAPASLTATKLLVAAGEAEGLARPLLIWRDARRSDLERPCSTPCMSAKPSGNAAIAAGCRLLLGDGRGGKLRGPSVSLVPGDL